MFYLSLLVVPSSRHDFVGDGPCAVPCDPEGLLLFFPYIPYIHYVMCDFEIMVKKTSNQWSAVRKTLEPSLRQGVSRNPEGFDFLYSFPYIPYIHYILRIAGLMFAHG